MVYDIVFKHITKSSALEKIIIEKSEKLSKFLSETDLLHVTVKQEGLDNVVSFRTNYLGKTFKNESNAQDFYTSVTDCVQKLYNDLSRRKEKVYAKEHLDVYELIDDEHEFQMDLEFELDMG